MKIATRVDPPSSQAGVEARLEGLQAELQCLLDCADGPRARSYLRDADQALWKAISLVRQGL